jgi:hypothetical protein
MSIEMLRNLFLWCAIINYGFLILWFVVFTLAHDRVYRIHGRWFRLSVEQFDAIHYAMMAVFKIGVLLLNVAPYVALLIIAR